MLDVLVARVLGALELEGRVSDGEVVARAFAQLVDDAVAVGAVGLVRDGHVRGDGHEVGGDGYHVQVVHAQHAVDVHHVRAQLTDVHAGGRLLHEDCDRAAQERESARRHEDSDQEGCDGVSAAPPERPLSAGRDDHRDGTECVVGDLQESGAHVEVRIAPARQNQQGDSVRNEAENADKEHRASLDLRRGGEAPRPLPRDHDTDDDEHAGLQGGGQDLGARPPPRAFVVARPPRQVGSDQRNDQAGCVHDHVASVRRQRQGSRPEGADQLGDDDCPRDRERPGQSFC